MVWQDNVLDYQPMIDELTRDIQSGVSIKEVSYKFHTWAVDAIIEAINKYSKNDVLVFSGGCFQNFNARPPRARLLEMVSPFSGPAVI